jgi:hypothetical protein
MSGGGSDKTVTQTNAVPEFMKPYVEGYMKRSQQVADLPYQAYGGQTVAQMNPYQTAGLGMAAQRGMNGSPVNSAAGAELTKTLSGGYLNNNPYMDALVNQAQGDVTRNYQNVIAPQLDALDARSGSFGNSGVQNVLGQSQYQLGQTLGDISTNLRGQDYANERNRMQGAISLAPQIANQDYVDANAVIGAGGAFQNQNQANLNDQYNRWQEQQNYPYKQLDTLGRGVGMNFGGTSAQTGDLGGGGSGGMARGALGGAAAGASIGSVVPVIGTGIGALGGGVLGAMGGK